MLPTLPRRRSQVVLWGSARLDDYQLGSREDWARARHYEVAYARRRAAMCAIRWLGPGMTFEEAAARTADALRLFNRAVLSATDLERRMRETDQRLRALAHRRRRS